MLKTTILLSNLSRISLIIIAGLVNTECFYSSTSTAYYGFCITVLFFVITSYHFHTTHNKTVTIKTPLLLFGFWCLYVLVHYFTNTGTLVFTIYSVVLFFLLLKATTLFIRHPIIIANANALATGYPATVFNPAGLHDNTISRLGLNLSYGDRVNYYVNTGEIVDIANTLLSTPARGTRHEIGNNAVVPAAVWYTSTLAGVVYSGYLHTMGSVLANLDCAD